MWLKPVEFSESLAQEQVKDILVNYECATNGSGTVPAGLLMIIVAPLWRLVGVVLLMHDRQWKFCHIGGIIILFLCPLSLISCLNDKWTLHLMCHVSWYQWRTWWRRFQGMPAAPPSYDASMAASGAGGFAPPPPPGQVWLKCLTNILKAVSNLFLIVVNIFPKKSGTVCLPI